MTMATTPATPASLLDPAIEKIVAAFSAHGRAISTSNSPRTTQAVMAFDDAIANLRKVFAHVSTPTVLVPEGFWLAPNRVTPEMTEAALEVEDLYRMGRPELPGQLFQAMRREAPLPPAISVTVPVAKDESASA